MTRNISNLLLVASKKQEGHVATRPWPFHTPCRPTTTQPLLDRLPRDVILTIANHLRNHAHEPIWVDLSDRLAWYQGWVGLSMVNKHLYASITCTRFVKIGFQWPGLASCRAQLPLQRLASGDSLFYQWQPPAVAHTFPVSVFDTSQPQAIVQGLCVFAPEVFPAYARLALGEQILQGGRRPRDSLTPMFLRYAAHVFRDPGAPGMAELSMIMGKPALVLTDQVSAPGFVLVIEASRVSDEPHGHATKWFHLTRVVIQGVSCR